MWAAPWEVAAVRRVWFCLVLAAILFAAGSCAREEPYSNPPDTFGPSELVGTWESRYPLNGLDTILFSADGTFKQVFREAVGKREVHETSWNEYSLERFPDGRIRLHLTGARYFPVPDLPDDWDYYDPIAGSHLRMAGELVLNVQCARTGTTVLVHMLASSDEGWIGLLDGKAPGFRRVKDQ